MVWRHYICYADHLGTPRAITRPSDNQVVWKWENSDPFGANLPNEDPSGTGTNTKYNLRFPGQYYDQETGTHYNYYRDYDSSTGRYIQSDPIGLRGGINTYAYVEGNPLSFTDPMGLAPGGVKYLNMPGNQAEGAYRDFLRNYGDMRDANTINADKYFHCKANCEATKRGPIGEDMACRISDAREWFDQYVKGDPASASAADQAANLYGRSNASSAATCEAVCATLRPNGLPSRY